MFSLRQFRAYVWKYGKRVSPAVFTYAMYSAVFIVGVRILAYPTLCVGPSMIPTIDPMGECVLVNRLYDHKLTGSTSWYKRGHIVIAYSPTQRGKTVCKRIAAVEGDFVVVINSSTFNRATMVLLNNFLKSNAHRPVAEVAQELSGLALRIHHIGPGEVWLAGDNPSNSLDSRHYGPLLERDLAGVVFMRLWDSTSSWLDPVFFARPEEIESPKQLKVPKVVVVFEKDPLGSFRRTNQKFRPLKSHTIRIDPSRTGEDADATYDVKVLTQDDIINVEDNLENLVYKQ